LAAAALKLTAPDLKRLGVIDGVVPEPVGGAHADWEQTAEALKTALREQLQSLSGLSVDELRNQRWAKYMAMGEWREPSRS